MVLIALVRETNMLVEECKVENIKTRFVGGTSMKFSILIAWKKIFFMTMGPQTQTHTELESLRYKSLIDPAIFLSLYHSN
jgi:hypothetical protein